MTSFYGYKRSKLSYGDSYFEHVKFLAEAQYWPADKINEYSWGRIKGFIEHAYQHTEFYKNQFKQINLKPDDFRSFEDFRKLPIINKKIVRQHIDNIVPENINKDHVFYQHTSGTTGTPLKFPISGKAYQMDYAYRDLVYKWGGIDIHKKDKIAFFSGHPVADINRPRPPFWSYDFFHKWMFFSSYHLSDNHLPHYIKKLEEFQPKALHGYPSSIYLIALANQKYGRGILKNLSIFTCSESLMDFHIKAIQDFFDAKIFDLYGSAESVARISCCPDGERHIMPTYSYVEILNDRYEPAKLGEEGRIVGTNFNNLLFPLIRYDLGDTVVVSADQNSKCGRGGLLIDRINGRKEEYIVTPDGRKVGRLDHLFKDAHHVKNAQLVQNKIDELIIKIVRENGYNEHHEKIVLKEARNRLGTEIKIVFDYVENIPKMSNGKYRFIVSKIQSNGMPQ